MYFLSIHINTYRLFSVCIEYVPDAYEFVLAGLETFSQTSYVFCTSMHSSYFACP